MNKGFKRLIAYIIDTLLISLIALLLANSTQINFQLDNYNKTYKNYEKVNNKYEKLLDKYNDAKDEYEDKKIKKAEYEKIKKEYKDYEKEYEVKTKKANYSLAKNSVITSLIMIALTIAYFAIFQFSMNGQTLGKKLMKLRVVKYKEGKLNIFNFIIRAVILNGIISNLVLLVALAFCNYNSYYTVNYIVTNLQSIIEIVILVMVFMNKDNRGLHDYLAGSKVIEVDSNGNEVEYIPPTKKEEK